MSPGDIRTCWKWALWETATWLGQWMCSLECFSKCAWALRLAVAYILWSIRQTYRFIDSSPWKKHKRSRQSLVALKIIDWLTHGTYYSQRSNCKPCLLTIGKSPCSLESSVLHTLNRCTVCMIVRVYNHLDLKHKRKKSKSNFLIFIDPGQQNQLRK